MRELSEEHTERKDKAELEDISRATGQIFYTEQLHHLETYRQREINVLIQQSGQKK